MLACRPPYLAMPDIPSATGAYRALLKLGRGAHWPSNNHTTPTATIERLNPGRRRGRLWCKLATIDGDLMDAPASGRGASGIIRVSAPLRRASP